MSHSSDSRSKSLRLARAGLFCILLALLLEFVFANANRLFIYSEERYPERELSVYADDPVTDDGSYFPTVSSSGGAGLTFTDVPGSLFSISFSISYTDEAVKDSVPAPIVKISATDPRTSWANDGFTTVATEQIAVGEGGVFRTVTLYASIESDGVSELLIELSNLAGSVEIQDLRLNAPPAWRLSFTRILCIAILLFLPCLLSVSGIRSIRYDPKNFRHSAGVRTAVLFTVALALLFSAFFLNASQEIAYPLEGLVRSYQPYIQQFDAFMKGQLHLDVPVPDALTELENPYDYDSRAEFGALWDRAYYNGKYYSYFGVAPIIVVYLPYYLLTGSLPSDSFVITFFLLLAAIFIPLTVIKWADLHEKKTLPLPLLWIGAVTAFIGSMTLLIARGVTPFYYIATIAGNAFLSLFLFLLLKTAEAERLRTRCVFGLLAGLAYACLLHSRLNIALLAAFLVIPFLFFRVLKKREEVPEKLPERQRGIRAAVRALPQRIRAFLAPPREIVCVLLSLAFPVFCGLTAALALNYARFDSIFEFGTTYQFTVSDISYNRVSVTDLVPAIFHYFFQPFANSTRFPFFALQAFRLYDYGRYVYIDVGFGLFSLPLMKGLLFSPAVFLLKKRTRYEKSLLACLLFGLVTVALLDFSLGGVIFRYTADITILAAIGAVCLTFAFYRAASGGEYTGAAPAETVNKGSTAFEEADNESLMETTDGGEDIPNGSQEEADGSSEKSEWLPHQAIPAASAKPCGMPLSSREKAVYVTVILFFLVSCTISLLVSISENGNLTRYASDVFVAIKNFFTFR